MALSPYDHRVIDVYVERLKADKRRTRDDIRVDTVTTVKTLGNPGVSNDEIKEVLERWGLWDEDLGEGNYREA